MELKGTYTAKFTRTEYIDVTITDATEVEVWNLLKQGLFTVDTTQEEYDGMSDEDKAGFLAEIALSAGLDYSETTDEHLSLVDCYRTD